MRSDIRPPTPNGDFIQVPRGLTNCSANDTLGYGHPPPLSDAESPRGTAIESPSTPVLKGRLTVNSNFTLRKATGRAAAWAWRNLKRAEGWDGFFFHVRDRTRIKSFRDSLFGGPPKRGRWNLKAALAATGYGK